LLKILCAVSFATPKSKKTWNGKSRSCGTSVNVKNAEKRKRKEVNNSMLGAIVSIAGYLLVGYLVSAFLSVSYGVLMNRHENEK